MESNTIGVGIVGSGFIARVHAQAIKKIHGAKLVSVADIDKQRALEFGAEFEIPHVYTSHQEMLENPMVEVVIVGCPNHLHYEIVMDSLNAKRHVICEKPLCLSIPQAMEMIETSKRLNLVLGYAEELCFIPKFVRVKELLESGGIGRPYLIRQCEKHAGPYSPWFWKEEQAGGGILMDMGCHSIECIRWLLGKIKVRSVTAVMGTFLHNQITKEEDHVIVLMEFENGVIGQAEASWALKGGMDSTLEVFGTEGVIQADLLKGMGIRAYSEFGFPSIGEPNQGWVFPDYEWLWNNGYPQEDEHFLNCIRNQTHPLEAGEDGLEVLEIMLAAYHSAGIGKKVFLPFRPKDVDLPVSLWQTPRYDLGQGPIP